MLGVGVQFKATFLFLLQWRNLIPLFSLGSQSPLALASPCIKVRFSEVSLPVGFKYVGIYSSYLQKSFSKGFSTSLLLSHFPHTPQPIMFTHLVTIFTTFTNHLLFAEFSRHFSSHLTLLFFTLPFSLKCPFIWHLRFCFSFSFLCFWPLLPSCECLLQLIL